MSAAVPRDSASVILLRDAGQSAEALLIRRHADLGFAGGTWVFPGGKLEAVDRDRETLKMVGLVTDDPRSEILVTACRETFEETGIVLAAKRDGMPCEADLVERLQKRRADLAGDPGSFPRMLAEHGLIIDAAHLIPWGHWITPSLVAKRFDTRFFLGIMPPAQDVHVDSE